MAVRPILAFPVCLLAAAALVPPSARAQSTLRAGPEFRVNEYTTGAQRLPSAAMYFDGLHFIVWEGEFQDGDSLGIFGRRVSAAGTLLGPEFQINQATLGDQKQPSVAVDAAGRFTVVWTGQDGSGGGVFARQFSAAGPLGPEFQVNTYTTGDQFLPRVSAGPGGLGVVWQSTGQDGSGGGVYGRLLNPAGAPLGGEFLLSNTTTGNQTAPVVAGLDNGRYAVAWVQNPTSSAPVVFSRLFDAAGAPSRPETQITFPPQFSARRDHVSIAPAPIGTFVVGWWEAQVTFAGKGGFLEADFGINLRFHDVNGNPTTFTGAGGAGHGSIARWEGALGVNFTGRVLVSYTSTPGVLTCFQIPPPPPPGICAANGPEDGSGSGIFARALGSPTVPPRVQVNTFTTGNQSRSSVAADPFGNTMVVWQSDGQDGSSHGIYAQRFGGIFPVSVIVDPAGNGVLDPGLVEEVRPSWYNLNGSAQAFGGSLFDFSGPAGGTYTRNDGIGFLRHGRLRRGPVLFERLLRRLGGAGADPARDPLGLLPGRVPHAGAGGVAQALDPARRRQLHRRLSRQPVLPVHRDPAPQRGHRRLRRHQLLSRRRHHS